MDKLSTQFRFLDYFTKHNVLANLLTVAVLISGAIALMHLNRQFLPSFQANIIIASVNWPGATSGDVRSSILMPIEKQLKGIDKVISMRGVANNSYGQVILEYKTDTDMMQALNQVKNELTNVNMPEGAKELKVQRVNITEPVAYLLISSDQSLHDLRPWAFRIESELLAAGLDKVLMVGASQKEINIQVPSKMLFATQSSLEKIGNSVRTNSVNLPIGIAGKQTAPVKVTGVGVLRTVEAFRQLNLLNQLTGQVFSLDQIADVQLMDVENPIQVLYGGDPAVSYQIKRLENNDSLVITDKLTQWAGQMRQKLPASISVLVYANQAALLVERIGLLLKNGAVGFVLIFGMLFLFLYWRVAFWVAFGIPISFAAALMILYLLGGTINMLSTFGFLLTIGIIVDDTIVVGEQAYTEFQNGKLPFQAAIDGAKRMLIPVSAASLTTISAFLPLILLKGLFGKVLIELPLVVIAVVLASVLECFLILPNHLANSFKKTKKQDKTGVRYRFDEMLHRVQYQYFRSFIHKAVVYPVITLTLTLSVVVVTTMAFISGRPAFNFFPSPPEKIIFFDALFYPDTPAEIKKAYMQRVNTALQQAAHDLSREDEKIIETPVTFINLQSPYDSGGLFGTGRNSNRTSMIVELTKPDMRTVSNRDIIKAWQALLPVEPSIESVNINQQGAGPPGSDVKLLIRGEDPVKLKQAATDLKQYLHGFQGVSNVYDNMPYGSQEYVFHIKPGAKLLGFDQAMVSRQLYHALSGYEVQTHYEPNEEIKVKVKLPKIERDNLIMLKQFPVLSPQGNLLNLEDVVNFVSNKTFNSYHHYNGNLIVEVRADVNAKQNSTSQVIEHIKQHIQPLIEVKHQVSFLFNEQSKYEVEAIAEMKVGLLVATVLIYIILACASSSYVWPILVMLTIPIALIGGIIGHLIVGIDMTLLSIFGMFGLAGIVVNNSIILLLRFKDILAENKLSIKQAIIEASCQRLRAVFLTTITTITGLLPIIFETSTQAQFLVPMAVTIAFGLGISTLLILVLIPVVTTLFYKSA